MTTELKRMIAPIERYIRDCHPQPDEVADELSGWVEMVEHDRGIVRVTDLAERVGASVRTVQRLFAEYVGVGPQWVIRRFHGLEALAAAHDRGTETDWAALAAQLGFADQPHLIGTFSEVVGTPPARYQRELA